MSDVKKIDIKEFREFGFLQELNRLFLHPMGMALEVAIEEDGSEHIGDIWDQRDDPEGMHYDLANSSPERIKHFQEKKDRVARFMSERVKERIKKLGFWYEPVPKETGAENGEKK